MVQSEFNEKKWSNKQAGALGGQPPSPQGVKQPRGKG